MSTISTCEVNNNNPMVFDFGEIDPEMMTGIRAYEMLNSFQLICGGGIYEKNKRFFISGKPAVGFSATNILATSTDGLGIALEQSWEEKAPIALNQTVSLLSSSHVSSNHWFAFVAYLVKKDDITLSPGPFNATASIEFYYE
ncbi:MAG: fimbrial protein [Plesiomonas sp.]